MKNTYAIKILKKLNMIESYIKANKQKAREYARASHSCYEDSVELPALCQVEKLNQILHRGKVLSNIRQVIVDAVNDIDKDSRLLLVLFYVRKIDKEKIQRHFKFSERTFYRRLKTAESKLLKKLAVGGFSEQYFAQLISQD